MRLQSWLAALAGARNDVLEQTPTDRVKYVTIGGVILTTAAVASLSAAFAMIMALHLAVLPSFLVGLCWGVVVLNLDRLLVIGMVRQNGWWRNAMVALPRLILAVLIGAIISMPLVLRIFQPEIESEILVLQNRHQAEFQEQLESDPRFTEIPVLERSVDDLRQRADRNVDVDALEDESVQAAQREVERTRRIYEQAQYFAVCEIQGECGTNVPGIALAARQRIEARDVALRDYDDARATLQQAIETARSAAQDRVTRARAELRRTQDELDADRAELAAEQSAFSARAMNDDGLLSRIEALNSLSADRPTLRLAHWAVFLLFLSLEVLPILVKLLQLGNPPTLYEQIISSMETEAKSTAAVRAAREREIAELRADLRADLELDRTTRHFAAKKRANKEEETTGSYREHTAPRLSTTPPSWVNHQHSAPFTNVPHNPTDAPPTVPIPQVSSGVPPTIPTSGRAGFVAAKESTDQLRRGPSPGDGHPRP